MAISNPLSADSDRPIASLSPHSTYLAQSIAQTFEYSANVHAFRPAVVKDDTVWNYQELNNRANHIAHKIGNVRSDTSRSTCVLCDHSPTIIAAIFGILKSGNAYVPIEPTYPITRMQAIMGDFPDALLVVDESHLALAEKLVTNQGRVITVSDTPLSHGVSNPTVTVEPDDLAYILYTSGSTGRPKGVVQDQKSIMFEIQRMTADLELSHDDRMALLFSTSFSASVSPLFGALLNGASVYMYDIKQSGLNDFSRWLRQNRISICDLNPTLFRALDNSLTTHEGFLDLRIVALTGEPVQASDVILYKKFFPHARLQNGFGSTETKTIAQLFIDGGTQFDTEIVPAGYPIPGKDLEILDDQGQPVTTGEIGEIVVISKYISPGYWSRNMLVRNEILRTEDHFDVRIYRSGDRGYFDDQGRLVCVGRNDAQIKINGVRIEPGEIEAILGRHPAIQQAVVLCCNNGPSNKQLVAYILVLTTPAPDTLELRHYLTSQLPVSMVPVTFVFLPSFPLLPNGKVDRRALPAPDHVYPTTITAYVAPRNSLESQLLKIWETIFGQQPIGVTDNFFNLGGESLLALRLCAEIERVLQRKVPVTQIFHAQTIEQLALKIQQQEKEPPSSLLLTIQADGENLPIFCVCFGDTFRPYLMHYPNQPLYMFFNQGYDGRPALKTTVEEIARMYLKDLRTIQSEGPYYLAGYSFGGLVAYEMAQQLRSQGETIGILILLEPTPALLEGGMIADDLESKNFLPIKVERTIQDVIPHASLVSFVVVKIFHGIRWRLTCLPTTFKFVFNKLTCRMFFSLGYSLPMSFRRSYTTMVVRNATRLYNPEPYPGKIILFQGSKSYEKSWRNMALEGLETHDTPPSRHVDMVKKPHAEPVLHLLMKYLEKAQRKNGSHKSV